MSVRVVVALLAALVAAGLMLCGIESAGAQTIVNDEGGAHLLMFSGFDLWRGGSFGYGGFLWSPDGLRHDGFTLKLMVGGGTYSYRAGTSDITGRQYVTSVLPGWRFKDATTEITVFGGLDLQQHETSPNDPGNRLIGFHAGARGGFDVWSEPVPAALMLTGSVSASTIGRNVRARAAAGVRAFDLWLGPEAIYCGDETYRQFRFGAHATGLRTDALEWSAGVGWGVDSDSRSGVYGRIGVLLRR
jgi:hypothetical protein